MSDQEQAVRDLAIALYLEDEAKFCRRLVRATVLIATLAVLLAVVSTLV